MNTRKPVRAKKASLTSSNKGEPTNKPTTHPTIAQLVRDCQMKPSLNHQYRVDDLVLQNIIVILLRESNGFLSPIDIKNLSVAIGFTTRLLVKFTTFGIWTSRHFLNLASATPTNKPFRKLVLTWLQPQ